MQHWKKSNALQIALGKAIAFSAEWHLGQTTRDGMPYILHPLTVMFMFEKHELKEMITSVLHDVLEDTEATKEDIIREVTDDAEILFALECLDHKEEDTYEVYIVEKICRSILAMKVKRKDMRHNSDVMRLPKLTDRAIENLKKYFEWTKYLDEKIEQKEKEIYHEHWNSNL